MSPAGLRLWFRGFAIALIVILLGSAACRRPAADPEAGYRKHLAGQWRSQIRFQTGPFASVKDLEFMYVFNYGGTMTESSNYDAAPPVPPAYGIWKRVDNDQFEARYEFYVTQAGSGLPTGRGVLHESITIGSDGNSYTSKIRYEVFDASGKPIQGGGDATGIATRLQF